MRISPCHHVECQREQGGEDSMLADVVWDLARLGQSFHFLLGALFAGTLPLG